MLNRLLLVVILLVYAGFVAWYTGVLSQVADDLANSQSQLSKPPAIPQAIVRFDDVKPGLVVPLWSWTDDDKTWAYVAPTKSIDTNYTPQLTALSVDHGKDWMYTNQIQPMANQALVELFTAAKTADHPLIVTSAYRSAMDQNSLYLQSQADYGTSWANQYVARPGHSEHQLGLAVDLSSYSTACQIAFANCHLDKTTASWLKDNAPDFGFILRYPPDKASITGVAHEPWHFRYVGKQMAKFVQQSGLTFDEISQKLITERSAQ